MFQSDILDSCSEVALHGAASSSPSDCSGKFASPAAQPEDRKCLQKELDVVDLSPSSHLSSLSLVSVPEAKPEEGWLSSRRDLAEAWSQFPATAAPCSSNLLVQVPSRFHAETKSVSSRKERAACFTKNRDASAFSRPPPLSISWLGQATFACSAIICTPISACSFLSWDAIFGCAHFKQSKAMTMSSPLSRRPRRYFQPGGRVARCA